MALCVGASDLRALAAPCDDAIPLAAGETWRDAGGAESVCFEVELAARGVLALDLSAPGYAARARLDFLGSVDRGLNKGPRTVYWKRAATGLVLGVREAGRYRFRIIAEQTGAVLPPSKLRTAFVEPGDLMLKSDLDDEIEIDPDPFVACPTVATKSDLDDEIEIDPDPFVACPTVANKSDLDDEIEIDPDPFVACPTVANKSDLDDEIEIDPDPFVACVYNLAALPRGARRWLDALCRQGEADDHGDAFLCATPMVLGRPIDGRLANGWGDDEDVFAFRLPTPQTVAVEVRSEAGAAVQLFDRFGHALAAGSQPGGDRDAVALVRTLSPGTYFLRLDGTGGSYRLRADRLP
ncbi:MAG: hypothetical protein D6696_04530 [Acidobacteria bacterium]|nr:MAG: hypothetical protein D6696_04530 [Acidobacteriota bacterium]